MQVGIIQVLCLLISAMGYFSGGFLAVLGEFEADVEIDIVYTAHNQLIYSSSMGNYRARKHDF